MDGLHIAELLRGKMVGGRAGREGPGGGGSPQWLGGTLTDRRTGLDGREATAPSPAWLPAAAHDKTITTCSTVHIVGRRWLGTFPPPFCLRLGLSMRHRPELAPTYLAKLAAKLPQA